MNGKGEEFLDLSLLFQGFSLMKIGTNHSLSQSVSFIFGSGL
jgi:hypothetical protein